MTTQNKNTENQRTINAARECGGSDFLRDIDDLAPSRPVVWLVLAWCAIVAFFLLMLLGPVAFATPPPKSTLPVSGMPGAAPPVVTTGTAEGGNASVVTSTTNTNTSNATAGAQAGAQTGPVTAGNSLSVESKFAQAPDVIAYPTAPCRIAVGGSAGWFGGALGISTSSEDEGCTLRETARLLHNLGQSGAALQVMCLNDDARLALQASGVACKVQRPAPSTERVTP